METFADIIGLWPTAETLGDDIGVCGVTVRAWRNRNSIPSNRWADVISAAKARGFDGVTSDLMTKIAAATRTAA